MRTVIGVFVCAAVAGLPGRLVGQQHPLPDSMIASFTDSWAEEMWLPTQSATDVVNAVISFENSETENRLTIEWNYQKTGALPNATEQSVDLSFRPTAVARRAGTSMKFYVVGWSDRTGRVIVESWTFGQYFLGSATPQGGGTQISTFSLPPITRVVEWISDSSTLPPVCDAACQTYGNKLLLLAHGTPTTIWSLDLASLAVSELYSAVAYPGLEGHRMLVISKHGADGLVAVSQPRRVWDPPVFPPGTASYLVMRDVNSDGTFDDVHVEAASDFYINYPSPWNNKYTGP